MSFSFEFIATVANAKKIIEQQHMPDCVRAFVNQSFVSFKDDALVSVKGNGHLHNGTDYQRSNSNIDIFEVRLAQPNPPINT